MTIDQYIEAFYNLLSRNEFSDSREKLVIAIFQVYIDLLEKLNGFYFASPDQLVFKGKEFEELLSRVSHRTPSFLEAPSGSQLPTKPTSGSSSHTTTHFNSQVHTSKDTKFYSGTSSNSTFIYYNCRKPPMLITL